MEYEKRKLKYLDRLKKTSSKGLQKSTGILDIEDDNSLCFNESHKKYVEPKPGPYNDLLAKVESYNRANPTSHITKNRLTVKRGLDRSGFVSNVQKRNNPNVVHKSGNLQDLENVISFIKPNLKLVKYNPDTKIKFGPPEATSTIKHKQQQQQHDSISQKKILKSSEVTKNIKYEMSEKIFRSKCSNSSTLTYSKIIRSNMQGFTSTPLDPGMNKNQCISMEEKTRLNLTYCLYLEFIHTHCDEIKSMNENVYPNNDYSINLKKQLQQVQLKHQQNVKNTKLTDCTDKSVNNFDVSSISSGSDFIFKPVDNLFKSPGLCISKLSEDSFVCSTQETLFTNTDDSMNIDEVKLEPYKEYFSSPEICFNENKKNTCQGKITDCESTLSYLTGCDTSLEKSTQKSKDKQKSSSISSEDSFKYYRKKMF